MNLAVAATATAAVPGVPTPPRAARLLPRRVHHLPARAAAGSATVSSSSSSSASAAASPVYAPTPEDRPLRTPHSG
jgi:tocopherol cyclase